MGVVEHLKEVFTQGFDLVQPIESPLTFEQENRISAEADVAYANAKSTGMATICPYEIRTRAYEIWTTRLMAPHC